MEHHAINVKNGFSVPVEFFKLNVPYVGRCHAFKG